MASSVSRTPRWRQVLSAIEHDDRAGHDQRDDPDQHREDLRIHAQLSSSSVRASRWRRQVVHATRNPPRPIAASAAYWSPDGAVAAFVIHPMSDPSTATAAPKYSRKVESRSLRASAFLAESSSPVTLGQSTALLAQQESAMTFRYSLSFEHDTQPIETVKGEITTADWEDAFRRVALRGFAAKTSRWRPTVGRHRVRRDCRKNRQ